MIPLNVIGSLFDFHSGLSRLLVHKPATRVWSICVVAGSKVDSREWGEDGSF